jgi:hypothetical protein
MKPTVIPTKTPSFAPSVVPSAVPTAAPTNALSILPVGISNNFKGTLFLFGTASASSTADTSNSYLNNFLPSQRSFIIFGREKGEVQSNLQIDSRESRGYYAEISSSSTGAGINRDSSSRSTTVVGDLNNDGFGDLVLGFPYASTCLVYLGSKENKFQNVIVSFAVYGLEGDEFGWSVAPAGDINYDSYKDMIICAKSSGICYVLYGKAEFINDIYIQEMTTSDGFRIIGSTSTTINFGMGVDHVGDFNKDGWNDFVISAMSFKSEGIVYIVYGRPVEELLQDIVIEKASVASVLPIITPTFAFAGLSVAGIGDLNNDGFADIAIGSIPYQGGFSTQRTYIVYGRSIALERNISEINEMIVGKDGFTIFGGGFLVAGIGDMNQDGIADCMISSYYNWQSKGNSYLMNYPRNMTSSPTFLPSSLPSSRPSTSPSLVPTGAVTTNTPSNHPSVNTFPPIVMLKANESASPSYASTFKPTKATTSPTMKKTPLPSFSPTRKPSTMIPTVNPSKIPTVKPIATSSSPSHRPTILPQTRKPTVLPTLVPTSNQTFSIDGSSFDVVSLDSPGDYVGSSNKNEVFLLSAPGVYHITTRPPETSNKESENQEKDVKMLSLVPVENQVIVDGFDYLSDVIDLTRYPTIRYLEDLSYSTNPLIIKLPPASSQPLFSASSSSSSSVSSKAKEVHSLSDSSSPPDNENSKQEQTLSLTSYKSLNTLSESNFRFTPSAVHYHVGVTSSGTATNPILISFGIVIAGLSVVFFLKCIQEDIKTEEKEEINEREYQLKYQEIEIDNENQFEIIIVQEVPVAPPQEVIENESVVYSDSSLTNSSLVSEETPTNCNHEKKGDSASLGGSWSISDEEDVKVVVVDETVESSLELSDEDDEEEKTVEGQPIISTNLNRNILLLVANNNYEAGGSLHSDSHSSLSTFLISNESEKLVLEDTGKV